MNKDSILNELHYMQQCYATLFSVTNKVQTEGDKYYGQITSRQHMTLIAIAHLSVEETTLINVASKLGTTKQTANKLISGLEKSGFVKIVPGVKDRRTINVQITPEGQQVMIDTSEKSVYFLADMFHEFTNDEVATFWQLLKKLYRFDGVEQDGLEAVTSMSMDNLDGDSAPNDPFLEKVLTEYLRRRNGGSDMEV